MIDLKDYGWDQCWDDVFQRLADKDMKPARVYQEQKGSYRLITEFGEMSGEVSGKFRHLAVGYDEFPSVGDWVAVNIIPNEARAVIHKLLPRRSKFSRKIAGAVVQEQIAAANFDYVLIVNSLNRDFNLRRLERYLTMAWESGASPVLVLSKKDLCTNLVEIMSQVESIAFGVPIIVTSAKTGEGTKELLKLMRPGKTAAILGSSGVGKSTLTNMLSGEDIMDTGEIREEDSKGRHTTTFRNLIQLKGAGMIIDTPGMRELQLWESSCGLKETFEDVESLGRLCRFTDCTHVKEPGCAVLGAVESGALDTERFESYKKLKKELLFIEKKHAQSLKIAEKGSKNKVNNQTKHKNSFVHGII